MANRIKLQGTSANSFSIGLNGVTLTSNNVSNAYTLNLPSSVGNNNQYLRTDGTGNLTWATVSGGSGSPGGSNTQLQFNDNGSFGGIPNVTFSSGNLSLGNVSNVKLNGGVNNEVIRTDGNGNLSFTSIALNLLVGTRLGPETIPINNYTFQVETRNSGNVTVYVN